MKASNTTFEKYKILKTFGKWTIEVVENTEKKRFLTTTNGWYIDYPIIVSGAILYDNQERVPRSVQTWIKDNRYKILPLAQYHLKQNPI